MLENKLYTQKLKNFRIKTILLYLFIIMELLYSKNIYCEETKKKILFFFGGAVKTDVKFSNTIFPLADTSYQYPPNTGPPIEDGMKFYPKLSFFLNIGFEYKLVKTGEFKILTKFQYETKIQEFKEYYPGSIFELSAIKYKFNYFQIAEGIRYIISRYSVDIFAKYNIELKRMTTFYHLNGVVNTSNSFLSSDAIYPNKVSWEFHLNYDLKPWEIIIPSIGFYFEPMFRNTDACSMGLQLILKTR